MHHRGLGSTWQPWLSLVKEQWPELHVAFVTEIQVLPVLPLFV